MTPDIAVQHLVALLKPSQLRKLVIELLTAPTPTLEATGTVAPAQLAERYSFIAANGVPRTADSADVAVIQDNLTGLQWGAKPLLDGKKLNHADAIKAGAECDLLGGSDWQLASLEQLHTVQDFSRHAPALQSPFVGRWPNEGWAWTRTDLADPNYRDCAWYVFLFHGDSYFSLRDGRGLALVCRPVPGVGVSPRQSSAFGNQA